MSSEFDEEFSSMTEQFSMVDPLSTLEIISAIRTITESSLFIQDYLHSFFETLEEALPDHEEEDKEITADDLISATETLILDLPALSHEATVYLRTMIAAAEAFNEAVTSGDEEEDDEEED
jgi:hypothetical protein